MRNYVKNKFKDRLTYCKDWKNSIELYLENKEISSKTNQEFYKSRPFLKIILDVYYLQKWLRFVEFLVSFAGDFFILQIKFNRISPIFTIH